MNQQPTAHDDLNVSGHELDHVYVPGIVWTTVGLVLLVVLALALMYGMLSVLNRSLPGSEPTSQVRLPPAQVSAPWLNPDQPRELQILRQREAELLGHYGWVDQQQGIARIPIERAMTILTEQGLPAASSTKEPPQ